MKKKIAMLLCLAIVLSACLLGCSGKSDSLVGTWKSTVDVTDLLNAELAADVEFGDYLQVSSFKLDCTMVFTKDGTYSTTIDEAALTQEVENIKDELETGMYAYLDDLIAEEGLDMSAEELLEEAEVSMEELMGAAFSDEIVDQMLEGLNSEGNFEAREGKLFLSDGLEYNVDETMYETYTLDGNTLTINAGTEDDVDETSESLYPMVFTRAG